MDWLGAKKLLTRFIVTWLVAGAFLFVAATPTKTSGATLTNRFGTRFVRIDPGTFDMDHSGFRVTLSQPFYIMDRSVLDADLPDALKSSPKDSTWHEASQFCAWLSRADGRNYRLPTEAEWEWARQQLEGTSFEQREWMADWYRTLTPDLARDPAGPSTGLTKVIRSGTNRLSLPPEAKSSPWGLPKTSFRIVISEATGKFVPPPFSQVAIKQTPVSKLSGRDVAAPYFNARFALPIPPDNSPLGEAGFVGLDPAVMGHLHSPGLEVLPNGDVLAIYFSAKDSRGASESDTNTCFVQARLRYGAEEWDPPELFCDFKDLNDQSGLLWREGETIRFFGGGRGEFPLMPFRMAVSSNNGATWTTSLPYLDAPARSYTPQPIASAFRGGDGGIYFAMDGAKEESFLWRSMDDGTHWHDMGGRTGARHSAIVPLDNRGRLLSIGGKNTSIEGWSPQNISIDYGATWSPSVKSPFPALGGNQRPCMIRLSDGHLCLVTDSYHRKQGSSPTGWTDSPGCVVAISKDDGSTWRIKRLPVELPHEADRKNGTLGYATVRQGPDGMIHLLATMTHPCLHYEFNEAWALSTNGDIASQNTGGTLTTYSENYPDGKVRISWSARTFPGGRYLLDGKETSLYENGQKQHEVTYSNGRKTGEERFWGTDGTLLWSWHHEADTSTWVRYWSNGQKRIESHWNTQPRARDLDRKFVGMVADGAVYHWNLDGTAAGAYSFKNGALVGTLPLSAAK
ncbi:MAG TPA: hypothetical protein VLT36_26600 [Candidatus Dormibacteraeota bacterium]|nr:hypothetical protein [Candidatus Dormibacteraeota bacterium]